MLRQDPFFDLRVWHWTHRLFSMFIQRPRLLAANLLLGLVALGCEPEQVISLEDIPVLRVEAVAAIEGIPGNLGAVRWAGEGEDSLIALNQINDHLVRLFDEEGLPIRSMGGPRAGTARGTRFIPLQGGMGWLSDTLWVHDASLARILLYDLEGHVVRTLAPLTGARPKSGDEERYPTFLFLWPLVMYPGDSVLVLADQPAGSGNDAAFAGSMHLLRISEEGQILAYLTSVQGRLAAEPSAVSFPSMRLDVPLSTLPDFHVPPGGDRVVLLSPDGTESGKGRARIRLLDSQGSVLLDSQYRFSGAEALGGIVLGRDHRIWIAVQGSSGERSWVTLNRKGEPQGRVLLREDSRLLEAGSEYLWISELDEVGAPRVVRYRIDEDS